MNKQDIILMMTIVLLLGFSFVLKNVSSSKEAVVYYEEKEILTIDLMNKTDIYEVEGALGMIKIEAGDGKIRVIEETSTKHLCSKQGYISNVHDVIVCLPNKIVIKIQGKENQKVDVMV